MLLFQHRLLHWCATAVSITALQQLMGQGIGQGHDPPARQATRGTLHVFGAEGHDYFSQNRF